MDMNHVINESLRFCAAGVAALLVLYAVVRLRVGRAPNAKDVGPVTEPPEGLSPAALRYVYTIGKGDNRTGISVSLISMAVKGCIRIEEAGGTYSIVRNRDCTCSLSVDEQQTANSLLGNKERITLLPYQLRKESDEVGCGLFSVFGREYKERYFPGDSSVRFVSCLIAVFSTLLTMNPLYDYSGKNHAAVMSRLGFSTLSLLLWIMVASSLYQVWRKRRLGGASFRSDIFKSGLVFGFAVFLTAAVVSMPSHDMIPMRQLFLIGLIVLLPWIVRYQQGRLIMVVNTAGRKTIARIESFKEYLSGAKATPSIDDSDLVCFERYLPHAIALNVELQWASRFSAGENYSPSWYKGSRQIIKVPIEMASVLSESFTDAVLAAGDSKSPPGHA